MKKILIIEDEPSFVKLLVDVLEKENFSVSSAMSAEEGIRKIKTSKPELLILDWNLPNMSGLDMCKLLKADIETKSIPIIMLTVKSDETDVVLGLEMGADDYIIKPFRPKELVARVRKTLRRDESTGNILKDDELLLNLEKHVVILHKKELDLRPKEYELLLLFLKKRGKLLTKKVIMKQVWEQEYFETSRTLDNTVIGLRKKLGNYGKKIETVEGVGYRYNF